MARLGMEKPCILAEDVVVKDALTMFVVVTIGEVDNRT